MNEIHFDKGTKILIHGKVHKKNQKRNAWAEADWHGQDARELICSGQTPGQSCCSSHVWTNSMFLSGSKVYGSAVAVDLKYHPLKSRIDRNGNETLSTRYSTRYIKEQGGWFGGKCIQRHWHKFILIYGVLNICLRSDKALNFQSCDWLFK